MHRAYGSRSASADVSARGIGRGFPWADLLELDAESDYAGKVSGTWQPIDVGSNGAMISGTSPDKSMVVTVVLCTEGKALVNLQFDSASNDPIDSGLATDIGRKQDAAIKDGMPS